MKTKFLTLIFLLISTLISAQNPIKQKALIEQKSEDAIYQLIPTQNIWTFI